MSWKSLKFAEIPVGIHLQLRLTLQFACLIVILFIFFLQKTYSFSYIRIFYLCKKASFIHLSWEQKSKYLIPEVSVHSSIETLSHFLVYNQVIRFISMIFATKPSSIKVFISIKRCKATENIDIKKLAKMSNKPPIRILKICKCVFQGL